MWQLIYEEDSTPEQGAQPEQRRQEAERTYTAPFRAAIDFFRLDAERRRPAPADTGADQPAQRRRGKSG